MSELYKRTISGIAFVSIIVLVTRYSPILFSLFFAFLGIISSLEFARLQGISVKITVSIFVLLYMIFPFTGFQVAYMYEIMAWMALVSVFFLGYYLFNKKERVLTKPINYFLFVGYVLIPFLLLIHLQVLTNYSHFIVLSIFLLIWCNDTFAYLIGKSIGKTKLFYRISPNKTIEGFLGGMAVTVLVSLLLYYFDFIPVLSIYRWIGLALLISVLGTIGDLAQSKLKRVAGVKDSGTIMPGHGGILDRLDSVIYVTPAVYILTKII
jgi:phosphatidate cytidylyltransferase